LESLKKKSWHALDGRGAFPRSPCSSSTAAAKQIQGKLQAQQLLALVAQYQRDDVLAALERAVRLGTFSLAAIRRILAAQAHELLGKGGVTGKIVLVCNGSSLESGAS
jgi:hypothetical protein